MIQSLGRIAVCFGAVLLELAADASSSAVVPTDIQFTNQALQGINQS